VLRGAPTPRLDKLATEGFRLTNFNVETECVPTRAALLTGRHPLSSGTLRSLPPGEPQGLVRWEVTLAELLSAQGYATAYYGKWHLGDAEGRFPTDRGFISAIWPTSLGASCGSGSWRGRCLRMAPHVTGMGAQGRRRSPPDPGEPGPIPRFPLYSHIDSQ
jgi:arylsulfatase A-like enzyme